MVLVQILIAENMTEMVDAIEEGTAVPPEAAFWGPVHYWLGISILAIMVVRLIVRLVSGAPAHAGDQSPALVAIAATLHWTFYVVLIAVPISGLVAYYGLADVGDIHGLARPVLLTLIVLHALAALYNQFVRKDGTLTRMFRPQA